jgi:hypothetical protein
MIFQCRMEQTLEIARNDLMRNSGRRHHHGDTIDEFPVLLV